MRDDVIGGRDDVTGVDVLVVLVDVEEVGTGQRERDDPDQVCRKIEPWRVYKSYGKRRNKNLIHGALKQKEVRNLTGPLGKLHSPST